MIAKSITQVKKKTRKVPVWFPYASKIEVKKTSIYVEYKGGEYEGDIKDILFVFFYGAVCDISENFISLCVKYRVPICIHRRNVSRAAWIVPSIATGGTNDILTRQILFRENKKKSIHISRKLLKAKFESMKWLVPPPLGFDAKKTSLKELVALEAQHAKRYWIKYYFLLGYSQWSRRAKKNPVTSTLDAISKLVTGVMLRYIVYHEMSPRHGFIHIPTTYPSLVYDLIEPYRGYIEKIVFDCIRDAKNAGFSEDKFLPLSVNAVEEFLDQTVYVPATRQLVTFQELLHGAVLALRTYLHGISRQYIVPIPGKPNGGRPLNVGYKLYGRSAGPTDFWQTADIVSKLHERTMNISETSD